MTERLGRLESVELRSVWPHEAHDFTPWLANNLQSLGDSLQLGPLELIGTEQSVGVFSVDVLARTIDGERVVIENQLEKSDHKHLGQLVTYAAGIDAVHVCWVLDTLQEEHRAALDWLNTHTDEHVNFWAVELSVVRIGTSAPAPSFSVVVQPNDWQKKARSGRSQSTTFRGWEALYDAIDHIPTGRYTTISELAQFVGTTSGWVGRHMWQHCGKVEQLHRMLTADGKPWHWYRFDGAQTEGDPARARSMLEAEGVEFDGEVATPDQLMTCDQLRVVLG